MTLPRELADRLAAAKLWLVSDRGANMPYLSTALFSLATVPTDSVPRAATDPYWRLYVNQDWLEVAETESIAAELLHQVWHLLADHSARAADAAVGAPDAARWRTAADLTVAQVAWPHAGDLPRATDLSLPRDLSAEEYYAALADGPLQQNPIGGGRGAAVERGQDEDRGDEGERGNRSEPSRQGEGADNSAPAHPGADCGSGCDGIPRPHDLSPRDDSAAAVGDTAAEGIRATVAVEWREHQGKHGSVPGHWGRWIEDLLDPVVPWPQVLRSTVRRGVAWAQGHSDYTYSRVSRRQAAAGAVVLPALRRPVPAVAIVVDTSGSVDDGLLAQAMGEVEAVLTDLAVPGSNVTVMAVDAAVQASATVRHAREVPLAGGGGTDMARGIAAAEQVRPAPNLIIVLTDGYTPWPPQPTAVPVVAAILGRERARLPDCPEWMQRVEVVPDDRA